jgi:hypothetical protein
MSQILAFFCKHKQKFATYSKPAKELAFFPPLIFTIYYSTTTLFTKLVLLLDNSIK